MKRHALLLVLLCSGAAAAQTVPPTSEAIRPAPTFTARDVFSLAQAGDVQISPDGKRIAYTRATGDIMIDGERREIWLVDVASGRQTPLGIAGSSRPRWSPDGARLAYAAKADGGRPQIFVRWMATGTSAAITALPQSPSDIAWSRDGRTIASRCSFPATAPCWARRSRSRKARNGPSR